MDDVNYFALNIRNCREYLNMSQADFARCLGVNQTLISRYELENVMPSGVGLCKIADALGVSPNKMMTEPIDWAKAMAERNNTSSAEANNDEGMER